MPQIRLAITVAPAIALELGGGNHPSAMDRDAEYINFSSLQLQVSRLHDEMRALKETDYRLVWYVQ